QRAEREKPRFAEEERRSASRTTGASRPRGKGAIITRERRGRVVLASGRWARQGNELDGNGFGLRNRSVGTLANQQQLLRVAVLADRNDQTTAGLELCNQRCGDVRRGGGDDDAVERRMFRPAVIAVADASVHVGIAEL